ncbi:DNA-3-methyladenine glycosylase 2 family protein [Mobilitalea sibirica]|uniref:DNA-(apurinic or apyrimidinic site) lyase n=1 Tax=Mobilitalea sibirica TaxID=1462919 RepID=A0A8J7H063_9FIRM|nr:DNA-3-methyladenine glycosylase 2 family protein [Mobilitalea sibirica]MBH1939332.1 DNA-3-methyladenine glycosylase 2 family protein [Mobilitalea sibirica]
MIIESNNINIRQIAESGQCFRMNEIKQDTFSLIAYGRYLQLKQLDDTAIEISCSGEEYELIWKDYFDLSYDYNRIIQKLMKGKDDFLKKAGDYGKGIRILRQEPFEILISFIISQNKNIPSIKKCIEGICNRYGEFKISEEHYKMGYYAFPTPGRLANAKKEELRELKLGYRDEYIIKAAQAIHEGRINLDQLKACSHEEAVTALKTIPGVGDKVANCISLYGLHHIEAFPVDVWINKVLNEVYQNSFDVEQYQGYAGIIQQYMFYYMRSLK